MSSKRSQKPTAEKPSKPRRKRRGRTLLRLLIVGVIIAACAAVWHFREDIAPDSLLIWVDNLLAGGEAGEGFPIALDGSDVLGMQATSDGYLAVMNGTELSFYNGKGGEEVRRSHGFSDPAMHVAGKYVLVTEKGGHRLRLETRAKTVTEIVTRFDILTAAVSENGHVAVLTAADQNYTSKIVVYDAEGKVLYDRNRAEQCVNIALSPDGRRVAVTGAGVQLGGLYASLDVYALSSAGDALYSYRGEEQLMYYIAFSDNNTVVAAGTAEAWVSDITAGTTAVTRCTDGELVACTVTERSIALVQRPYGSTRGGTVSVLGTDGQLRYRHSFDGAFRAVGAYARGHMLMTEGEAVFCGNDAKIGATAVSEDGLRVAVFRNRIVVLGLTELSSYALPQGS